METNKFDELAAKRRKTMRNDLPPCILRSCRFYFDGNCTNRAAYENCEQRCLNEWLEESQKDKDGWISTRDRFPEDESERVLAYSPEMEGGKQMSKWIKCSERMPPTEQKVLVVGCGCSKFITTAMYEDGTVKVDESKWEWGEDYNYDYRKEPESNTIPEGWIEVPEYVEEYEYYKYICDAVVYWMPLPSIPPEEV